MIFIKGVEKQRVVLRNAETGELVADTKIIECDAKRNTIRVPAISVSEKKELRVDVLVFAQAGLQEYNGVMRGASISDSVEVALSRGREKENRGSKRFPVHTEGLVEGICYKGKTVILNRPIWIRTNNISRKGLLFCSYPGCFEIGDRIQLVLDIQGNEIRAVYEVVRRQNGGTWSEEYGCKIVSGKTHQNKK